MCACAGNPSRAVCWCRCCRSTIASPLARSAKFFAVISRTDAAGIAPAAAAAAAATSPPSRRPWLGQLTLCCRLASRCSRNSPSCRRHCRNNSTIVSAFGQGCHKVGRSLKKQMSYAQILLSASAAAGASFLLLPLLQVHHGVGLGKIRQALCSRLPARPRHQRTQPLDAAVLLQLPLPHLRWQQHHVSPHNTSRCSTIMYRHSSAAAAEPAASREEAQLGFVWFIDRDLQYLMRKQIPRIVNFDSDILSATTCAQACAPAGACGTGTASPARHPPASALLPASASVKHVSNPKNPEPWALVRGVPVNLAQAKGCPLNRRVVCS